MATVRTLSSYAAHVIDNKKSVVDPSSLEGKYIGLYFSAHWCGPCRRITPLLAEKYKKIVEAGGKLEIIFVSSDENEGEALDYFKTMPWKMLHFDKRDLESELSEQFEIRGIPTLVLLDEEGNVLSTGGTEILMEFDGDFNTIKEYIRKKKEEAKRHLEEVAKVRENFSVPKFFADKKVIDRDGKTVPGDYFRGKVVGLYFSAHWCPPCRGFTPRLAEKFKAFVTAGKPFEIIFISSDRDAGSAKEYFDEMPWKMLDYDDRAAKGTLSEAFQVQGIPTLLLFNDQGMVTEDGREAILEVESFEKLQTYDADKKAEQEKFEAEISGYPETVTIDKHEHPLKKLASAYGHGHYGCDLCHSGGVGWVYQCEGCGFDVHPQCVMKLLAAKEKP